MLFHKIQETTERFDTWCHLLVRHLKSKQGILKYSDTEIISDIIKSKFHYWKGEEEPDGLTIQMDSRDQNKNVKSWTLKNHKFYGFFDNSKISSSNYNQITFEIFQTKLFSIIDEWNNNEKSFKDKAKKLIKDTLNPSATFYHLNLDEKINTDMVAKWQVYSVFIAFISIDRQKNIVTLIEFGQD